MDMNKHESEKTTEHTENTEERRLTTKDELTDFLLYTAPDGQVKVECILHDETIWLTQDRIAELFDVQRSVITKHLKNIFESGELEGKVVSSILEHTTQHGAIEGKTQTRSVKFYNLDAIISVGYRVNSSKNTEFSMVMVPSPAKRPKKRHLLNTTSSTKPSASNPTSTKPLNNSRPQRKKETTMNKNIRVHLCSFVVSDSSVYSVGSVVKNGGAQ